RACRLSIWPPLDSTLFPYTTLFRSRSGFGRQEDGYSRPGLDRRQLRARPQVSRQVRSVPQEVGFPCRESVSEAQASSSKGLLLRSEEHTSELQSRVDLVCRLLLQKN